MNSRRGVGKHFRHNNQPRGFLSLKILLLTFLLAIFLISFLPLLSAVEVDMNPEFAQGETLLARISGNFIDQITRENVFFYRGHVKIPVIYDVVKIEDEFYIYAVLAGKTQGNYSLSVEGVRYYRAAQIVDDALVSNFTISNETALFSVNPGALITKENFSVEIQNLQDRKITVAIAEDSPLIVSQTPSLELKSGEKKNLFFNIAESPERGLVNIGFVSENFSYILPVYLDTNATSNDTKDFEMEFQPSVVEVSIATNSDSRRILYLTNTGEETIENILLDVSPLLDPYVTISPDEINTLDPNSTEEIEIQITSGEQEAILEGDITASSENLSSSFTLILNFTQDFIPVEGEEETVIVTTCDELGGTICAENQQCAGDSVYAKDGVCCLAPAECTEAATTSSTAKWIGWGLLVLAFVFLYWFYKRRYKKVERKKAF